MTLADAYRFEAEFPGGATISDKGIDLSKCVKFTLIPNRAGLPIHSITGVQMVTRFGRGFVRALGGGMREYVQCVVCRGFRYYVKCSDGSAMITPEDYDLYL